MANPLDLTGGVNLATTSGVPESQKPCFYARPSSPDTNCPICLEEPQNKSYTDTCRHQFCFHCLREWAKVKPECPLCKQIFRSIIHNIRSAADYDEHRIENTHTSTFLENTLLINLAIERRGIRYSFPVHSSTTVESRASGGRLYIDTVSDMLQSTLPFHQPLPSHVVSNNPPSAWRRFSDGLDFRRQVYFMDLWSRPDTSSRRESSPDFYRNNPAQTHRLVPWINRELNALLSQHNHPLVQEILNLIERHPINSRRFADALRPHLGHRTAHFCYEFYCFATSIYEMVAYDVCTVVAQYDANNAQQEILNFMIPSDSDSDIEEIIQMSGPSDPTFPTPRMFVDSIEFPAPRRFEAPLPMAAPGAPIPLIEISDSSDTDARDDGRILNVEDDSDSSGVEIIATFPANRTPEIITIDSDDDMVDRSDTVKLQPTEKSPTVKQRASQLEEEPVASTSRRVSYSDSYNKDSSSDTPTQESYSERKKKRKSRSKKKYSKKKSSKRKRSRSQESSSSNRRAHKRRIRKEYMISPVKEECGVRIKEEGEEKRPRLRSIVKVVHTKDRGFGVPLYQSAVYHTSPLTSDTESEDEKPTWRRKLAPLSPSDSSDW